MPRAYECLFIEPSSAWPILRAVKLLGPTLFGRISAAAIPAPKDATSQDQDTSKNVMWRSKNVMLAGNEREVLKKPRRNAHPIIALANGASQLFAPALPFWNRGALDLS